MCSQQKLSYPGQGPHVVPHVVQSPMSFWRTADLLESMLAKHDCPTLALGQDSIHWLLLHVYELAAAEEESPSLICAMPFIGFISVQEVCGHELCHFCIGLFVWLKHIPDCPICITASVKLIQYSINLCKMGTKICFVMLSRRWSRGLLSSLHCEQNWKDSSWNPEYLVCRFESTLSSIPLIFWVDWVHIFAH